MILVLVVAPCTVVQYQILKIFKNRKDCIDLLFEIINTKEHLTKFQPVVSQQIYRIGNV